MDNVNYPLIDNKYRNLDDFEVLDDEGNIITLSKEEKEIIRKILDLKYGAQN